MRWFGGWRENRLTFLMGNMAMSWVQGKSWRLEGLQEIILKERRQRTTGKLNGLDCRGRERAGCSSAEKY